MDSQSALCKQNAKGRNDRIKLHFLHILNLVKEGLILFFAISVISFLECVYQGKGGFSWTNIVAVVLVKTFVTSSVKLVWAVDVS